MGLSDSPVVFLKSCIEARCSLMIQLHIHSVLNSEDSMVYPVKGNG